MLYEKCKYLLEEIKPQMTKTLLHTEIMDRI